MDQDHFLHSVWIEMRIRRQLLLQVDAVFNVDKKNISNING